MYKKIISMAIITAVCASFSTISESAIFGKPYSNTPSVISYGWYGLLLGALGGLSAGYIRYADEKDNSDNILKSVGYGTLSGAGLGLIIGAVDMSSGKTGMGGIIMRDMYLGGLLGLTLGGIGGGIEAIGSKRWESVGKGAAWGYLAGIVFGITVASIEGPGLIADETSEKKHLSYKLTLKNDSRDYPYPSLNCSLLF